MEFICLFPNAYWYQFTQNTLSISWFFTTIPTTIVVAAFVYRKLLIQTEVAETTEIIEEG